MFKQSITALICAVLLVISSASLYAESKVRVDASDDLVENFAISVSLSAFLVIIIPIYYLIYRPLEATSDKYNDSRAARLKAKNNVPDMEVKEISEDENGQRQVHLQDPNDPENFAILIWPNRQENQPSGFQKGEFITFQASPQRSGWLLRDNKGAAMAFLPVDAMQQENYSSAF